MMRRTVLRLIVAATLVTGSMLIGAAPAPAAKTLTFGNQPADSQKNKPITATQFDANDNVIDGPYVTVQAGANTRVTVAIDGGANLQTVRADGNGVATFTSLSIATPAVYTLKATASGWDPGFSNSFRIFDTVVTCSSNSPHCDTGAVGSLGANDMTAQVEGTAASPGLVAASLGIEDIDCPDFDPATMTALPTTVSMFWENLSGEVVITLTIDKEYDHSQTNNGANFYQICFTYDIAGKTFKPRGWQPGDSEVTVGLLPDCSPRQGPACIESRSKDKKGNVLLVVRVFEDAKCG